jgi:hypothetical protein
MKNIPLLFLIFLCSGIVHAQSIRINEPQFDGNIIYANDTVGDGIQLEKLESLTKASSTLKTLMNGKATIMQYVKNCCSAIRINQKGNLNFLVPFIERQDPVEYIKVFKMTSEKKIRTINTIENKMKVFGTGDPEQIDTDFIKFTYNKYGERSYLITISSLSVGEYAITVNSGKYGTFYLFGID